MESENISVEIEEKVQPKNITRKEIKMKELTKLPNIGKTLASKLNQIGIYTDQDLKLSGSENAIIKIATIENSGACINMLYALEGAIQGIRWHNLDEVRKRELREFFKLLNKKISPLSNASPK